MLRALGWATDSAVLTHNSATVERDKTSGSNAGVFLFVRRRAMVERMEKSARDKSAAQLITERIAELGDWRGEMLAYVRKLIHDSDPQIVEEWKWRGVPV